MDSRCKKAGVALAVTLASLGALRMSSAAATLIEDNESAVVDGWNITAPTGVSLTVTSSGSEIYVEKTASFTEPNQGFQVGFQPVSGASAATSVDFTDESIQNNTGAAFKGFEFILMNVGTTNATFDSVTNVFAPPSGTGYDYTSVKLNADSDILTYKGKQSDGSTSSWGSAAEGDNLLIDTPSGSDFSFKELSESGSGGGGGGGGGGAVPLPAAIWQSFGGLGALALFGLARMSKRRRLA